MIAPITLTEGAKPAPLRYRDQGTPQPHQVPWSGLEDCSVRPQAYAVLHCTVGDIIIAALSLLVAFAVVGRAGWPISGSRHVWLAVLFLGVGYTV